MPVEALARAANLLSAPDVPVKIGNLRDPQVLLGGLRVLAHRGLCCIRRVRGRLLLGIVADGGPVALGGLRPGPEALVAMPFTGNYNLSPIALKLDIVGVLHLSFLPFC